MQLYLPPPLLLVLLTCVHLSQAKQKVGHITCSEQQGVTVTCPLAGGSGPVHPAAVLWFISSGTNASCDHPDYVERFMSGGHHHQALYDIRHHHFMPDNHRTSLQLSDDGGSVVLSVRNLRSSDSGLYCCVRRARRGHSQGPQPGGTPGTLPGSQTLPREHDKNGTSPKHEAAHRYSVLTMVELLVTQAQGDGVKTSPACHGDAKADARDVTIVILISVVIISVIVIVITCYRAQKRRGRVVEREMSNIYSPTSPPVMSPDPDTPVFDFEYQPGLQGGALPRPGTLHSVLEDEVFTGEHTPVNTGSTLQLVSA